MTAKYGTTILKGLQDYQGTAANTAIVGATAGLEALVNLAVFSCPCIEPSQLSSTCTVNINGTKNCNGVAWLNYGYGISYLVGPAVLLFVVGVAATPKLWKLWTGCFSEEKGNRKSFAAGVLLEVVARGLISPIAWVLFGLLDGKYYACAVTPLPYDFTPLTTSTSCFYIAAQVKQPQYGAMFKRNKGVSQLAGWISIAGVCVVGFVAFACSECNFPLTYYHAKYYKLYRNNEEAEFDDEMGIKAQTDAEANIRYFMKERREKSLWDKISTVYSFHRDKKKLALYSYLHEWVIGQRANESKDNNGSTTSVDGANTPLLSPEGNPTIETSVV